MTTATAPAIIETTITRRTRNLGYGWSTTPERYELPSGNFSTRIATPSGPDAVGTVKTVEQEMANQGRVTSGGAYSRGALFVGGRPIVQVWTIVEILLPGVDERGWPNSRHEWRWVDASEMRVRDLVNTIIEDNELKVRLG